MTKWLTTLSDLGSEYRGLSVLCLVYPASPTTELSLTVKGSHTGEVVGCSSHTIVGWKKVCLGAIRIALNLCPENWSDVF